MAMKIVQQDERAILSGHKDFPMFSVIMPIYNGERYLEQAIISVMTQTEDAWELILINDGSIDSSSDICRKYAAMDSRILLIEKGAAMRQRVCPFCSVQSAVKSQLHRAVISLNHPLL